MTDLLAGGLRAGLVSAALLSIAYATTYSALSLFMLLLALREVWRQRRFARAEWPETAVASQELPGISVIVPAYNEEASIVRTVVTLAAQRYPDLEIIVVSDGSTDTTLRVLSEAFDLRPASEQDEGTVATQRVRSVFSSGRDPRLRVVDKRNGGKADALNVGINLSRKPLACVVDADVILDPWALYYLSLAFIERPDTVAASGTIRLYNGCQTQAGLVTEHQLPERALERFQVIEYIRAFGIGRLFFNSINSHVIISGAFGVFSRRVLQEIGGFQPHAIGEDMELVVRIQRRLRDQGERCRIAYVADALCFTEGPRSAGELGRQRTRWHQGLLTTLRLHRSMLFNPRYGMVGLFALPFFACFELMAPVVEVLGVGAILWGLLSGALLSTDFALLCVLAYAMSVCVTLTAVFLDDLVFSFFPDLRAYAALAAHAVLEPLGYHQLTVFFRLRAFPRFYRSIHLRAGWKPPARTTGS